MRRQGLWAQKLVSLILIVARRQIACRGIIIIFQRLHVHANKWERRISSLLRQHKTSPCTRATNISISVALNKHLSTGATESISCGLVWIAATRRAAEWKLTTHCVFIWLAKDLIIIFARPSMLQGKVALERFLTTMKLILWVVNPFNSRWSVSFYLFKKYTYILRK